MIYFDQAAAVVGDIAKPLGSESVPIGEAHRRVLAEPVVARVDSPPSDVSAMDGYAVREEDLLRLPAQLRVIGESFAGSGFTGGVSPGSCVRIFTGAPVPPHADRVVIQEIVRREGDFAVIDDNLGTAKHVRGLGSDFRKGAVLVGSGARLGYRQLVAAAGADLAEVKVWRRPNLLILGTGDELATPGSAADTTGAIPESVSFGVAALAEVWGASIRDRLRLPDDLKAMERAAAQALDKADLVVVTGGASVGEKDFAKAMFERQGLELLFSKVAIKPGKPVWLGRAKGKLVMGLPGNPTSALVTARLLLAPLVAGLSGLDPQSALRWRKATLLAPLPACGDRETFVRAREFPDGVEPVSSQDSSAQKMLVDADLLLRRRAGAIAAVDGDIVAALDF
ncbi:molybdopterin molybdotransferase MoeA [Sphingomonas sp. RB56-2]|uniref:Molybdopterin molybdenumtransferase n=1 Tax=Sphingomonas brevis TaxID=2908206 RepID=A0ABT0S8G4_9SPHN|nr:molybdopterin molybdotransferase MoeA [Sphingomonas brevis]